MRINARRSVGHTKSTRRTRGFRENDCRRNDSASLQGFHGPRSLRARKDRAESGFITQGPVVEAFEAEMRAYLDNDHVLTTNSATSATHIAIHLLKRAHGAWPGLNQTTRSSPRADVHGDELSHIGKRFAHQVGRRRPGYGEYLHRRLDAKTFPRQNNHFCALGR